VTTADNPAQPLRRAIVLLHLSSGTAIGPNRSTVTDDSGRFSFTDLPAGSFTVTASKAAYVTTAYGTAGSGGAGTAVTLTAGQHVTTITIVLPRGAVITGTVKDQNGEAAPGISVSAFRSTANDRSGTLVPVTSAVITDDQGVYRIFGLAAGTYIIGATPRESVTGGAPQRGGRGSQGPPVSLGRGSAITYYPGTPMFTDAKKITLTAGEEQKGIDFKIDVGRGPGAH
jgi:uncharacterized protein (DUF2141 family)